jgi:hypothetical protein
MAWSNRHQPLTIADLVIVLGVSRCRLRRCLDARGILPAFRVGRVPCYVRDQLDEIALAVARCVSQPPGVADDAPLP